MAAAIDIHAPRKVAIVASNPATSPVTGWPIGFWWSELTHPCWELTGRGYDVTLHSPEGGPLTADSWSDPRDESGYSAEDLITLGFVNSPDHLALVERSRPIADIDVAAIDAVLFIGGQGPMVTFRDDTRVHALAATMLESGKLLGVICHATCLLLTATCADGSLITGQQQYSGAAAARLMIEALGA